MRIVIITQNEPFFIPKFIETVLKERKDVRGIISLSPHHRNENIISNAMKRMKVYGIKYFTVITIRFISAKAKDKLSMGMRYYSVNRVAAHYRVPVVPSENINSKATIKTIKAWKPDLIVSISAPQIFNEEILSIPPLGCINVHGALLPKYRGLQPSFWVLANDEKETGSTIHYMTKELDEGAIIAQKKIRINKNDTQMDVIRKTKSLGARLLLETLPNLEKGNIKTRPNIKTEGSYYSFPKREDVEAFWKKGKKLL